MINAYGPYPNIGDTSGSVNGLPPVDAPSTTTEGSPNTPLSSNPDAGTTTSSELAGNAAGPGDNPGGIEVSSGGGDIGGGNGFEEAPVVLDLTGKGINITQLGSSNTYMDMSGDGLQNRTAWAGAGNAVLGLDLDGTGKLDNPLDFDFTAWDPTATTDLQALLDVFDTNHDGKLDAGDLDWSAFRLMVTNADGSTSIETLAQAGIVSINLISNNQTITYSDGSQITGETTYTTTSGSTGAVADVSFAVDPNGYVTQQTTTHNADGSTTIDVKTFTPSGQAAGETISTVSSDGLTKTLKTLNGAGVLLQSQTEITVNNADGSKTETLSDFDSAGILTDKTITTTSADGKTVTLSRDVNGDGAVDQTDKQVRGSDGSFVDTISNLNRDGTLSGSTTSTTSADGLTKTTSIDLTGDDTPDLIQTDDIVVNADGSRTETVSTSSANGTLIGKSVTTTDVTGDNKTTLVDSSGDGTFDRKIVQTMVVAADGSSVATQKSYNANGISIGEVVTSISADGLTKKVQTDIDGNGTFDLTTTDQTVKHADGSKTETITDQNANLQTLDQTTITTGADGVSRTILTDSIGSGHIDHSETIALQGDGSTIDTVTDYGTDGTTLIDQTVTTTSADGLSVTTQSELAGLGGTTDTRSDKTIVKDDRSKTETIIDTNGTTVLDQTVVTTSADGQSVTTVTTQSGPTGSYTATHDDAKTLNPDGSTTELISDWSQDGKTLLDQTMITTSADKNTVTKDINSTGDGVDQTQSRVVSASGSDMVTVTDLNIDQSLKDKTVTTTSADGLSVTTQSDPTGSGHPTETRTDVTTLNADGSRTETVTDKSGDGTAGTKLFDQTIVITSANGLSVTTQSDPTGSGHPTETRTDVTILNADGGKTETITDKSGDGTAGTTLLDQTIVTTSANGLSVTTQSDPTGSGHPTRTRRDVIVLGADGSTTETITDRSGDGTTGTTLIDQTVTTTTADQRTETIDSTGNGQLEQVETISTATNGIQTKTLATKNAGGATVEQSVVTTSANGLLVTTTTSPIGGGTLTRTDETVLNADGSKTETITDSGMESDSVTTTISANGLLKTTLWDLDSSNTNTQQAYDTTFLQADGSSVEFVTQNGVDDNEASETVTTADGRTVTTYWEKGLAPTTAVLNSLTSGAFTGTGSADFQYGTSQKTVNDSGQHVTTLKDFTTGGALQDEEIVTTSANGLSVTTQRTSGGATTTRTDVTALNADGSTQETVTDSGAENDEVVVTTTADGLTKTSQFNPSAVFWHTQVDATVLNTDGSKKETVTDTGTADDQLVITTSGNGMTKTTHWTSSSNGIDESQTDNKVLNTDGSLKETIGTTGHGTSTKVVSTSANGLSKTTTLTGTGVGVPNQSLTDIWVKDADGSTTETVTNFNDGGTTRDQTSTITSADGRTVDVTRTIFGGSGLTRQTQVTQTNADGSVIQTTSDVANGIDGGTSILTISPDGLTKTTQWYLGGSDTVSQTETDITAVNLDGSSTETISEVGSNGVSYVKGVLTTSADGRIITLNEDTTGNGFFDHTETTTIALDGSKVIDTTDLNPDKSINDTTVTTVSANGLEQTVVQTVPGLGLNTSKSVRNLDGTLTTTETYANASGVVLTNSVTTVSADGYISTTDFYQGASASGALYAIETFITNIDGSTTSTTTSVPTSGGGQSDAGLNSRVITSSAPVSTATKITSTQVINDILDELSINTGGNETTITGTPGRDVIKGGTGTEILNGGGGLGGDTFIAGQGAETLNGSAGNDIYVYGAGDGDVTINDLGGSNTLKLSGGAMTASNITFDVSGDDLIITDGTAGDQIRIDNQYWWSGTAGYPYQVQTLVFGDNSTLNLAAGLTIVASGNGAFGGTPGNNIFVAGTGGETLSGNAGNDVYSYAQGDGSVTIADRGGSNTLVLGQGLTAANVEFDETGTSLLITDGTLGDVIDLQTQYAANGAPGTYPDQVQTIVFGDGSTLNLLGGLTIRGNGDGTFGGTPGNDTLIGGSGAERLNGNGGNDTFIGGVGTQILDAGGIGNNLFIAGQGSETLIGATGNDSYSYIQLDGASTLVEAGGTNSLTLGGTLTLDTIVFAVAGNNLLIRDGLSGDLVDLQNQYYATSGTSVFGEQIQTLVFSDGSSMSLTGGLPIKAIGTSTTLNGTPTGHDTLIGGYGTETMIAHGAGDTFIAGIGTETMIGAGGDIFSYVAGEGIVTLSEAGGTNTLLLGSVAAANITYGLAGNNLIITDGVAGDLVTIVNQFGSAGQVQKLVVGGSTMNLAGGLAFTALPGNQTLIGNNNPNTYIAGVGSDTLEGGNTNDVYLYAQGDGSDTITETGGGNTLRLGAGLTAANVVFNISGNDLIIADGTAGDRIDIAGFYSNASKQVQTLVFGDSSSMSLTGGLPITASGNGTWSGVPGNVGGTFIASVGTETLNGGGGNDIYSFAQGDGTVVISDGSGTNTLMLGAGLTAANVVFNTSGNNLLITDGTAGDQITIVNEYNAFYSGSLGGYAYWNQVQKLVFGDGTTLNLAAGLPVKGSGNGSFAGGPGNDTLIGGAGSETLNGNGGNDTLIGGTGVQILSASGNDTFIAGVGTETLNGGGGNDIYSFAQGDGTVVISDGSGTNTLMLGAGLTAANVVFNTSGNNLLITDGTAGDQVTILNEYNAFYSGSLGGYAYWNQVQKLVFGDGTTLNLAAGLPVKGSGNGSFAGGPGNDTLIGGAGSETLNGNGGNDTLIGGTGVQILSASGNDTFIAGVGTETLNGGGGNDTYSFAQGDGTVVISDGSGTNTLMLGAGLTAANVVFNTSGNNLLITDGTAGDQVTILNEYNAFYSGSLGGYAYWNQVQKLVFGDGTTLNLAAGLPVKGSGNGSFAGGPGNDTLIGGAGSETLNGNGGNDTLIGGTGVQILSASGNDTFIAGVGTETLNGGTGNDTYSFAQGDGTVVISDGSGSNTLMLGAGLTAANVVFSTSGNNLLITDGTAGDQVTILNEYNAFYSGSLGGYAYWNQVQKLVFGDGISLNLAATLINGTPGNDTLTAGSGNVVLMGGAGNDTDIGGNGNDVFVAGIGNDTFVASTGTNTYIVEAGDGADTIKETGGTNMLIFGGGIARDQLWFSQSGQDLDISVIGTNQQVVVQNWYASNTNQVQQIETAGSGSILANIQVANLVNAMASLTPPSAGQTTLTPDLASQIEPVIAANWH